MYNGDMMNENLPERDRRDPIELLAESFLDEIIEFVKLVPFIEKFIPVLALMVMSRPVIMAITVIVTASAAFLANNGIPPLKESLLGMVCFCFAVASSHMINDFCDAETDRMNRRTQLRPIVLGLVEEKTVLVTGVFLALLSLIIASRINLTCVLFLAVGIILMFTYSVKLKQTQIGFLLPAFAAFLIPQGAFAVYKPSMVFCDVALVMGLAGFFFQLVPYWSQNLSDMGDRETRQFGAVSVFYGGRKTASSILMSFIICLLFFIYLHRLADLSMLYFLFTAISGGLLVAFLLWFVSRPSPKNARIFRIFHLCSS